jgi:hypothetical protein
MKVALSQGRGEPTNISRKNHQAMAVAGAPERMKQRE